MPLIYNKLKNSGTHTHTHTHRETHTQKHTYWHRHTHIYIYICIKEVYGSYYKFKPSSLNKIHHKIHFIFTSNKPLATLKLGQIKEVKDTILFATIHFPTPSSSTLPFSYSLPSSHCFPTTDSRNIFILCKDAFQDIHKYIRIYVLQETAHT